MRIAIIKENVPRPSANVINTIKQAQAFFELGHEVIILSVERYQETLLKSKIKNIHSYFDINKKIVIKYFKGSIFHYFQDIRIIQPFLKILKLFPLFHSQLEPENKISRYCKKNKINLTFCRDTPTAGYNNVINNVPCILETHYYDFLPDLKKFLSLSRNMNFKGVVTISNPIRDKLLMEKVPNKKILVVEDAVDLKSYDRIINDKIKIRKALKLPLNKKIILYSGSLVPGRGIDTIIKSSFYLEDDVYYIAFIGGDKTWIKKWKRYIKKNHVHRQIAFLGQVPVKDIPIYLKAADILLVSYTKDLSTIKWMSPLKLFEYMASKVPIISSDLSRLKEICNNNECLFFQEGDPKDLSEKIKDLINNENLQQTLIKNAYNKAVQHTYLERAKKILELI